MESEQASDQLMLWPEVSPASLTPLPALEREQTTSDTSGLSSSGSSATYDLLGLSLRTFLVSALPPQTRSSAIWRRAATPSGRQWWVLATLGLPTSDDESSSSPAWPTATATRYGTSNNGCPMDGRKEYRTKGKPSLEGMARQWPTATAKHDAGSRAGTPRASADAKAHPGTSLLDAVTGQWATPSSQDAKNDTFPKSQGKRKGGTLPSQFIQLGLHHLDVSSTNGKSRGWRTPMSAEGTHGYVECPAQEKGKVPLMLSLQTKREGGRGVLNPRWVLQLMGFPKDWLNSVPPTAERRSRRLATRSSRQSRK